jgi:hypothetical protein
MKEHNSFLIVSQYAKIVSQAKIRKVKQSTLAPAWTKPAYLTWLEMSSTWGILDIELMTLL